MTLCNAKGVAYRIAYERTEFRRSLHQLLTCEL